MMNKQAGEPSSRDARIARNLVLLDGVLILSLIIIGCLDFFAIRRVSKAFHLFSAYSEPLHDQVSHLYLTLKDERAGVWRLVACEDPAQVDREIQILSSLNTAFLTEAKLASGLEQGHDRDKERIPRMILAHDAFFAKIERFATLKKSELSKRFEAEAIVSAFDDERLSAVAVLEKIIFLAETDMNRFEEQSKILAQSEQGEWRDVTGILAETFDVRYPVVQGANKARSFLYEIQILFQEYVNERNPDHLQARQDRFETLFDQYERQLQIIQNRLSVEKYKRDFAVLEKEVADMRSMADGEKGLVRICGDLLQTEIEIKHALQTLLSLYDSSEALVQGVMADVEALNENMRVVSDTSMLRAKVFAVAVLLFALLLSIVAVILFGWLFRLSARSRQDLLTAKCLAENLSRQKTVFLANVSHELRTPLTGIVGYAELIFHGSDINRMRRQGLEILTQSEHLITLVNDLLDTAKITAGKMELIPAAFDLPKMLQSVELTVRILAEKKGLKFDGHFSPNLPRAVVSDQMRLRQVLLNLLSNAIKFTKSGRVSLDVRCVRTEERAVTMTFMIEDTGVGIAEEHLERLFSRFEEGDQETHRHYGGTGLGLNLSRELVKLMGGDIRVSTLPDRGSTFIFTLTFPVDPDFIPQEEPVEAPDVKPDGKGRSVLVVEDYPVNQDVLRIHLESAGYKVTVVETGVAAIEAVGHREFDLVLLDINLPDMDGMEVARQIRALKSSTAAHIPILALTAALDQETRDGVLSSGMNHLLTKPIRRDVFLKSVSQWASQRTSSDA